MVAKCRAIDRECQEKRVKPPGSTRIGLDILPGAKTMTGKTIAKTTKPAHNSGVKKVRDSDAIDKRNPLKSEKAITSSMGRSDQTTAPQA